MIIVLNRHDLVHVTVDVVLLLGVVALNLLTLWDTETILRHGLAHRVEGRYVWKIFGHPASVSASRCKARFWSTVETRASPISIRFAMSTLSAMCHFRTFNLEPPDVLRRSIVRLRIEKMALTMKSSSLRPRMMTIVTVRETKATTPARNHFATVNGMNPSEKSPSGTDLACQWS